jgi:hypothetical protein
MPRKDAQQCQKIRDRVNKWDKYWRMNRALYYEWIDFVLGDQWREDESKLFERYNKVPLESNKLGVMANHLMGDQMMNTPNLQVLPDDNVPQQAAEIRAALVKNITFNSDSKTVFQTAFMQSIVGGFSAWAVFTDYEHDNSFYQEIKMRDFYDPCQCYWDIAATTKTKTDGGYSGFKTRQSRQLFKDKWGKDVEASIGSSGLTEDSTLALQDDNSITQIDDFEKIGKKLNIYQLNDDALTVVDADELKKFEKVNMNGVKFYIMNGRPANILQTRSTVKYKIKHRQVAGDFILEEEDFPGKLLPVVFVDQRSYYTKSGQQITRSFFKDVKDTQRFINYLFTQTAYLLKVSRWDQFIMPRKCAANPDTAQQWRDPSAVRGAIYYDETPSGAKPEQLRPPELSQSLYQQWERALMDLQSGTGMYNTQMGEMGNEVSGTAIDARTQRGVKNTYVPFNSLNHSISVTGEIVNGAIPEVYDTFRTVSLSMPDSESKFIGLNKPLDPYGLQVENDVRSGRYKIRLKPGPSYEGQKEQALQSLQSVLQADKSGQVFPLIADLYADNLPLDNTLEIRNRLRTIVPPEIIEAGKTGQPVQQKQKPPAPEEIMAKLKEMELQQKMQQAQHEYEKNMRELTIKEAELKRKTIETQQDVSVAWAEMEAKKEEAAAKLQETILRYQAETGRAQADERMAQSDNLVKLLIHATKEPKQPKTGKE